MSESWNYLSNSDCFRSLDSQDNFFVSYLCKKKYINFASSNINKECNNERKEEVRPGRVMKLVSILNKGFRIIWINSLLVISNDNNPYNPKFVVSSSAPMARQSFCLVMAVTSGLPSDCVLRQS